MKQMNVYEIVNTTPGQKHIDIDRQWCFGLNKTKKAKQ